MLMPRGRTRVSMKLVSLNQFAAPAANDDFSSSEDSEDIDEVPYATICIVKVLASWYVFMSLFWRNLTVVFIRNAIRPQFVAFLV